MNIFTKKLKEVKNFFAPVHQQIRCVTSNGDTEYYRDIYVIDDMVSIKDLANLSKGFDDSHNIKDNIVNQQEYSKLAEGVYCSIYLSRFFDDYIIQKEYIEFLQEKEILLESENEMLKDKIKHLNNRRK